MARPERVAAIVSQNGNAYEEGLGDAWAPIRRYWVNPSAENRETLHQALNPNGLRWQYVAGAPDPNAIAPEGYTLDAAMIARPGNMDIQLDLLLDYANNVKLYPAFQEYFRKSKPPLRERKSREEEIILASGEHPVVRRHLHGEGVESFARDNSNAAVRLLDAGHFALETHVDEIAAAMRQFLGDWRPRGTTPPGTTTDYPK
jgi:hypothetical protein